MKVIDGVDHFDIGDMVDLLLWLADHPETWDKKS
jgi:hypothetical protein